MLVKTDLDGFFRDQGSKAVINTNVDQIRKYRQERDERLKLQAVENQQQEMVGEINNIKQDLNDIKVLLQEISKRL